MRLRFSRFTANQKPDGYRANNGCESEYKTKGRQVLKKRGIHVFDLWEWVRNERNNLTVTEISRSSLCTEKVYDVAAGNIPRSATNFDHQLVTRRDR